MSDRDDRQVGYLLTRREVIAMLGATGATLAAGPALAAGPGATGRTTRLPSCVVRPTQTRGPYFVDERLVRTDIRSDPTDGTRKAGAPLGLTIRVSRIDGAACAPFAGAYVDLWQCDALGEYAGVRDTNGLFDTRGRKFLRGAQLTNAAGEASFVTIYPGWYPGRCVHLHFMIRTDPDSNRGTTFASQLYFDDALTDRVHAAEPYSGKTGQRRRNAQDGIYRNGGERLMLDVTQGGPGWSSSFDIGLLVA